MRIVQRHVPREGPVRVQLEDGSWVDETPPTCDECGFVAKTDNGLAAHERAKHGDDE